MKKIVNIGDRLEKYLYSTTITEGEVLKILNVLETYGGVKSVKQYSIDNNISKTGVYNHRKIHTFIDSKFVIDSVII
jgi:hypothetical protein